MSSPVTSSTPFIKLHETNYPQHSNESSNPTIEKTERVVLCARCHVQKPLLQMHLLPHRNFTACRLNTVAEVCEPCLPQARASCPQCTENMLIGENHDTLAIQVHGERPQEADRTTELDNEFARIQEQMDAEEREYLVRSRRKVCVVISLYCIFQTSLYVVIQAAKGNL